MHTLILGDVDLDGRVDAVGASSNGVYLLSEDVKKITSRIFKSLTFTDFDNDGDLDIVGGGDDGSIYIMENKKETKLHYSLKLDSNVFWESPETERFQPGTPAGSINDKARCVAIGDIDNDGDMDIMVGGVENFLYVFVNNNGEFTFDYKISVPASYLTVGDVDNDGDVDIVSASGGNLYVLENDNGFSVSATIGCGGLIGSVVLDDVFRNGYKDIVAASTDGHVYISENDNGSFSPPINISCGQIYSADVGDVDNDGDMDIVASGDGVFYLATNENDTFNVATIDTGTTKKRMDVLLADVDSDGDLDIISIKDESGAITIVENNDGDWSTYYEVGSPASQILVDIQTGDVDNDGDIDVVAASRDGSFYLFMNNNGFVTGKSISASPGLWMNSVVLGDVDNDANIDILGANNDKNIYLSKSRMGVFKETIKGAFLSALQSYAYTGEPDAYNNQICVLPLNISSLYRGVLILENLSITYDCTVTTNDVSKEVNDYIKFYQNYSIPLNFTSESAGRIQWSVNVAYAAPYMIEPIPSTFSFPEDTDAYKLINLCSYFRDNKPVDELTFEVVYEEDITKIHATVDNGYLSFITPTENWYGSMMFRVNATDKDGYWCESNNFTVTVTSVNDAPAIALDSSQSVEQNITKWLNLTSCISDVDNSISELTITTTSSYITVYNSNHTLKLYYTDYPYEENVRITVSDGVDSSYQDIVVTVKPYGAPIWSLIPTQFVNEDENVTSENATLDLNNYVKDRNTPLEDLDYAIVSQTNSHINVSIMPITDMILVYIEKNYYGSTLVKIMVSDGVFSDNITFMVVVNSVNDAPVYLGGLTDETIYFGQTWTVDLNDYFYDVEDEELSFGCSNFNISINQWGEASWSPLSGAKNLTNVVFTAFDSEDANVSSPSINLRVIEEPGNTPPVYNGTLTDVTLEPYEMWTVNLDDYFYDAESDSELFYYCNNEKIEMSNRSTAYWCPTENDIGVLSNVVFTAVDPENANLTASSLPINITVTGKPLAEIKYIHPKPANEGDEVSFSGEGKRGVIVAYEWKSDLDGPLSNNKSFTTSTLSVGVHTIYFRVQSSNGLWSDEVNETIEIKKPAGDDEPPPMDLRLPYFIIAMIFIIIGIISTLLRFRK
jgi:hypothetical protein